jgi:glycosyltransferase involved in cell wall biosynthesis
MTARPSVTVIVPAYNAAEDLEACLAALAPSRDLFSEIIVVDDGSTDDSASIAARMGARVVVTPQSRSGAATARNIGAGASSGDILIFVDADVCVHPDTVERALALLAADPGLGAVSGSYDDEPHTVGDVSVWRNLLHCYTHHTARTDTRTFWTGFGAIRRQLLEIAGGFDPGFESTEDMELGARLRAGGARLRLDPSLLVKHRKRWNLWSMIGTDVVGRAIPYTRLILRIGLDDDLNVKKSQRASVTLVWVATVLAILAIRFPQLLAFLPCAVAGVAWLNRDFYRFLAARRGVWFALRMFPVHLLFFFYSGAGYLYARYGWQVLRVVVFLVCALASQWHTGAYRTEAVHPDEPGHFVTGLMIHDYVLYGRAKPPLAFARDYYAHYPKLSLGHWPPMFYLAQALWMIVFPATRNSVLVMMALVAAMLAEGTYALLFPRYGSVAAWCGSLALLSLPGVMASDARIMTEIPQALLMFGAMVAIGKYLDRAGAVPALKVGVWSAAALLTKGSSLALAPVPVIGVALTGRWRLLRSPWFWAPALIVLLVAGPWYLLAPDALHQKVMMLGGPGLAVKRLHFPPMLWVPQFGWAVSVLACAGLFTTLVRVIRGVRLDSVLASAFAFAFCASVFPFLFMVWENRHQIEAAPAFILLAAAGLSALSSMLPWQVSPRTRSAILIGGVAVNLVWNVAVIPVQPELGYRRLAQAIRSAGGEPIESVLILSDALGEGALIAELAQLEVRPPYFVLRSSKFLAHSTWMGRRSYFFETQAQLEQLLAGVPLQLVVLDQARIPHDPHADLLSKMLSTSPDVWEEWRPAGIGSQFLAFRRRDQRRLEPQARDRLTALQRPE